MTSRQMYTPCSRRAGYTGRREGWGRAGVGGRLKGSFFLRLERLGNVQMLTGRCQPVERGNSEVQNGIKNTLGKISKKRMERQIEMHIGMELCLQEIKVSVFFAE